jgi:hypothetical protein
MKTIAKNLIPVVMMLLLLATCSGTMAQSDYVTISGQLKDAKTGEKISYATITVPNTGIGTVSNSDGEFILKVNTSLNAEYFEVSHLGYATAKFRISDAIGRDKTFTLDVQPIQLNEISISSKDAREIVEQALKNIKKNYSETPNMMTGFYREYIKQRRDYLSISEAVVDIRKAAYQTIQTDQVKIFKGRKGSNVKKADTLMVKLQGGPNVLMLLDIIENPNISIGLNNLDNYRFSIASVVTIDDKLNWVINFAPDVVKDNPLYVGKLYVSQDNYAITRAEFSLDLSDEDKASQLFVQKKPAGLVFMPTSTNYLVTYKEQNGKYYLNYVRIDLKFTCDWKRKLFKNNYSVMSEMAITDRSENNIVRFTNQEVFRADQVFTERVQDFTDADFWGSNNIIEPEQSIENAIKKLSKTMKK